MIWKTCAIAPEYEVSAFGEIRSKYTGRPLVGGIDKDGYRKLVLCTAGARKHARISALVCEAFHGPRPAGHVVRHLDGSRTNDAAANLAWGTQAENIGDKVAHGTNQIGERHPRAKLTESAIREIRAWIGPYAPIAARFGVTTGTISAIRTKRIWAHVA